MARAEAGFSLIEAVAALAILGISLGVALGALSQALDAAERTRARADMLILAENLLTDRAARPALTPVREQGTGPGPYTWRLLVEPRQAEVVDGGPVTPVPAVPDYMLFTIRAEIRPSGDQTAAPLILETQSVAWLAE